MYYIRREVRSGLGCRALIGEREMFRRLRFERCSPKQGLLVVSEGSNGGELEADAGEDRWLVDCTVSRCSYRRVCHHVCEKEG